MKESCNHAIANNRESHTPLHLAPAVTSYVPLQSNDVMRGAGAYAGGVMGGA